MARSGRAANTHRRARRPGADLEAEPVPVLRPVLAATLDEPPHANIVCRVCGRIVPLPLDPLSEVLVLQVADRYPDGWSVDHVALSLAGACQSCREGRTP